MSFAREHLTVDLEQTHIIEDVTLFLLPNISSNIFLDLEVNDYDILRLSKSVETLFSLYLYLN